MFTAISFSRNNEHLNYRYVFFWLSNPFPAFPHLKKKLDYNYVDKKALCSNLKELHLSDVILCSKIDRKINYALEK